jgi:hypothetical protein
MPRVETATQPAVVKPARLGDGAALAAALVKAQATQRLEVGQARRKERARIGMYLQSKQKRLEAKRRQLDARQRLLQAEWDLLNAEAVELDNEQSALDAERLAFNLNSDGAGEGGAA